MWPGFKLQRRNHMWVESVVCSLPCSERFFPAYSGFSLSSKTKRLLKFPIPIPIPTKNQFESYLCLFISQFPGIWIRCFRAKSFLIGKKGLLFRHSVVHLWAESFVVRKKKDCRKWMTQLPSEILVPWIMFYLMHSPVQRLNNQGQVTVVQRLNSADVTMTKQSAQIINVTNTKQSAQDRTGTSIDNGARKSNNWLDQWQSSVLGTGSRV